MVQTPVVLRGSVSFVFLKTLAISTHAVIAYFRMRRGETLFIEHLPCWAVKVMKRLLSVGQFVPTFCQPWRGWRCWLTILAGTCATRLWRSTHTRRPARPDGMQLSAPLPHGCALVWLLWTPQAISTLSRAASASVSGCSLTTLGNSSLKSQTSLSPMLAFATQYKSCSLKYCVDRLFSWCKTFSLQ